MTENVSKIKAKIKAAAERSGRTIDDITLIGVTKTVEPARIRELLFAGVRNLGENKVQEFLPKYDFFKDDKNPPVWHFIGHLQKNKVKYIIDKVKIIHSVDSLSLAEEINKQAKKLGIVMKIMIEINIADEDTKFGLPPNQALDFYEKLQHLKNVEVIGLMCLAPFVENAEENRHFFQKMRNLLLDIKGKYPHNVKLDRLSMGMSGDFEVAIEESSNMVRIGTALFGNR